MNATSLVIVFLLIFTALPLYAEDSWVLWQKGEQFEYKGKDLTREVEWEILDGFSKESDCKASMAQIPICKTYTKGKAATKDDPLFIFTCYCLPACTDPRKQ
jgi:hypothetical protein